MPHSLWNGTIAFGMVRVPVKLYSATESKAIQFHERHIGDGAPIEHRRICAKEHREVPYEEVVKGFETTTGRFVVLSKEEIAAADGPGAHLLEIEHFVCREEIDPVFYERTYYLGPGALGEGSYDLLYAALSRSDRVGVGRFVFHNRARLAAVTALGDVIRLHTMRFADELVGVRELDIPAPGRKPGKREIEMANTLVEQLSAPFEPDDYADTYRDAVMELIRRKASGEEIEVSATENLVESDDLLAALKASLERAPNKSKGGNGKRGEIKHDEAGSGGKLKQDKAGSGGKAKRVKSRSRD
jgi:DNA end-binding protein Ku